MALLTVLSSAYAIFSLRQLNDLAYRIINEDVVIGDISKKLIDALIAQESAEKRYLILREPSIEAIFLSRYQEFSVGISQLRKSRIPATATELAKLAFLHNRYGELFSQEVEFRQANQIEEAQAISEKVSPKIIDEMALHIRAIQKRAESEISARMNEINRRSLRASDVTAVLSVISLMAGVILVFVVTYNISRRSAGWNRRLRSLPKGCSTTTTDRTATTRSAVWPMPLA